MLCLRLTPEFYVRSQFPTKLARAEFIERAAMQGNEKARICLSMNKWA